MKKEMLDEKVRAVKNETHYALQTVYDSLNNGQKKKIVKDPTIKALFERYGVEVQE